MIARSLTVLAVLTLLSCAREGGGETGNPVAQTPIALSLRSTDPSAIAIDDGDHGALIEEAWFAFGAVDFLDDARCAQFGDLDVPGDSQLIADLTEPNPGLTIDVEEGEYCGMVVPLPLDNAELPEGAPIELENHSIVLRGARADGTAFLVTHPEHDELELAAEDGDIAVGERAFVLSFDVAALMEGVDLDGATPDDDGVIRISGTQNRALLDRFEQNLECSLELYEDLDGDGELDDDEPLRAKCAPEEDEL